MTIPGGGADRCCSTSPSCGRASRGRGPAGLVMPPRPLWPMRGRATICSRGRWKSAGPLGRPKPPSGRGPRGPGKPPSGGPRGPGNPPAGWSGGPRGPEKPPSGGPRGPGKPSSGWSGGGPRGPGKPPSGPGGPRGPGKPASGRGPLGLPGKPPPPWCSGGPRGGPENPAGRPRGPREPEKEWSGGPRGPGKESAPGWSGKPGPGGLGPGPEGGHRGEGFTVALSAFTWCRACNLAAWVSSSETFRPTLDFRIYSNMQHHRHRYKIYLRLIACKMFNV